MKEPFSSAKPTEAGAYWWKKNEHDDFPILVELYGSSGRLFAYMEGTGLVEKTWKEKGGLWSPRLVALPFFYEDFKREISNRSITQLPGLLQHITRICSIKPVFKDKEALLRFVGDAWDMGGVGMAELREESKNAN